MKDYLDNPTNCKEDISAMGILLQVKTGGIRRYFYFLKHSQDTPLWNIGCVLMCEVMEEPHNDPHHLLEVSEIALLFVSISICVFGLKQVIQIIQLNWIILIIWII